jgi:5-methylcytosine-specific restriction endonuclease McrA
MTRKPNCVCAVCSTAIYRRPCELERNAGNAYCSRECYGKSCQRPVQCVICGTTILGSRHSKTCSRVCANKNRAGIRYKSNAGRRKDKVTWAQGLKTRLVEQRGPVCERCGYAKVHILVIHHIVGRSDGGSDELDNLMLVCPNCHAEIHYEGVRHSKRGLLP